MTGIRRLFGTVLAMTLLAGLLQAQSLGEVARREAERRKAVASPGKVYTNDTLRVAPLSPPEAAPADAIPADAIPADAIPAGAIRAGAIRAGAIRAGTAPAASTPAGTESRDDGDQRGMAAAAAGAEGSERGEDYWRERLHAQREALRRAEMFVEALQSRINALTADFTARDDPAQRDLIALDRQRTLEELDRLREEIAGYRRTLAATEEEARRAGVPPGWLR